jgi:hypothetical protein
MGLEDFANIAFAIANPQGYNAMRGYLNSVNQKEATPVLNDFQKKYEDIAGPGAERFAADPASLAEMQSQGLQFPDAKQMQNPAVYQGIEQFKQHGQNLKDLTDMGLSDPESRIMSQPQFTTHGAALRQFMPQGEAPPDLKTLEFLQKQGDTKANKEAFANMDYLTRGKTPDEVMQAGSELSQVTGATPEFIEKMQAPALKQFETVKPDKPEPNFTEEQLTARALMGDKQAQAVLDAMQKRKIETAKANRVNVVNNPTKKMDMNINGLSDAESEALSRAIDNGLDPYKVNSRTAKIYAQQEMKTPGRAWNALGAQAAFERNSGVMNTKALLNTIDPLLGKLEKAGSILGNSTLPGFNRAANFLKEATGRPDIVGFNNLRDDVVAEVERGLMGSGVLSDSKYQRAMKNINSAQSVPQLKAAIANTRIVIQARLESLAKGPNAKPTQGGAAMYAKNPKTGHRITSTDGGKTWNEAK